MTKKTVSIVLTLILLIASTTLKAQQLSAKKPPFLHYENSVWVDSIMTTLSVEEKIAQLIMVRAFSNKGEDHKQEILKMIAEHKIGGLIFFQGDPDTQVQLMNAYQNASKVPLLGAMDAEWGLGMRLESTISYPFQMALGAIQDDTLLYEMGIEVAKQLKRTGMHINFAPVVDVNNNANNPVINYRSFGENKDNVAKKASAYMSGMQDEFVLTTAKHFPGHGDTDVDSHYALPQINHSLKRLDTLELFPFRKLIAAGLGGIMVAHLNIPALDSTGVPSTLSKPIVTDLLKNHMGFEGLIITDAMTMKAVTQDHSPGIVDRDAVLAGNDVLELVESVPSTILEIKKALKNGLISQEQIDEKVRKVLAVKQWVGLHKYTAVNPEHIVADLNSTTARLLNQQLVAASLTVLKNESHMLPFQQLDEVKFASVSIGAEDITPFQERLKLYTKVDAYQLPIEATSADISKLQDQLKAYDQLIIGIHDESQRPSNTLKFSTAVQEFIGEWSQKDKSTVAFFKNPYVLDKLANIEKSAGLIIAYQDSKEAQELTAEVIFGGIGAQGKLPVSIGNKFKYGEGINLEGGVRFSYTLPEAVGMDSDILNGKIDSLMNLAMDLKAIPGGQVLVAKNQKVVFHKAYGFHTYSDTIKVKKEDLYDLASVTKISSAMAALMTLYDEEKFDLDGTLADYLPSFKNSNKSDIPFRDILTHQARFQPWIPFYKNIYRKNGGYKWWTIKKDSSARYPVKVAKNMYLHRNYSDKIVKTIRKSPLLDKKAYVYSDFFFILSPRVVESMVDDDFSSYLQRNIYQPLGATTITFNPLDKYGLENIVPTENDFYFRHLPIHGTVHDEGAIMLGGISGHAGLFANANDLAKLMQMYLNMGTYGGKRYIEEETLRNFSKTQFPESDNKRALGFDKRRPNAAGIVNNTAADASESSFGHTGFTGTMVWLDPEADLLYIFLSNRVSPTRDNVRLYNLNTRTEIQQVLYEAIKGGATKEK
ncbi:glycoside hydrolase family 3 N-terminal domain-containing protein [Gelidibacter sp.]|uniref:glycoside hydrolase family 3 N-terminal domain-containing protein n=1 Tax=Gelidibacter sp. TaxID=2018083 RepID=UPI002C2486B7|nr:glycoside hydrolase family 3 N-terminal domain-containing protein [Gelidibacter sp.]HUH28191.1 glycoside hydrolase family 3 N-terminal domain-containing protein [Gelidibacter sp.]